MKIAAAANSGKCVCLFMRLKISLFGLLMCCWGFSSSAQHILQLQAANEEDKKVLQKYSSPISRIDSSSVQQEVKALLGVLWEEGYLLAVIDRISNAADTSTAVLSVGKKFRWARLEPGTVEPQWLNKTSWRRKSFSEKPFRYRQTARLLQQLVEQAESSGYPFSAARLDSVQLEGEQLHASLRLEKGPYIVFDTLVIEGESRISSRFLAAHLGIKQGEPYSQQKVENVVRRLRALPYLQLQELPKISFQNEQATLYLALNKKRSNVLDGIIGLLPDPEQEGRLLFTGQFDLALHNPFGGGKEIELHWQRLNRNSQNLEASYFHPYLFGSIISLRSGFNLLKEEEKFVNRQLDLEMQFRQGNNNLLRVLAAQKDSRLLAEATEAGYGSFRLSQFGLGFSREQLDDPILPQRGYLLDLRFTGGEKEVRSLAGGKSAAGNDPDGVSQGVGTQGGVVPVKSMQYRAEAEFYYYLPLGQRLVWAHQITTAVLADKNMFINDLFRLGGLGNLRGFREKSFFASDYVLSRLEFRYLSGQETYLFLFYDQAWMEQLAGILHVNDWPLGFGAGLSLATSSGTFNFVYGLGKSETQELNFSRSQIHFGYLNRF